MPAGGPGAAGKPPLARHGARGPARPRADRIVRCRRSPVPDRQSSGRGLCTPSHPCFRIAGFGQTRPFTGDQADTGPNRVRLRTGGAPTMRRRVGRPAVRRVQQHPPCVPMLFHRPVPATPRARRDRTAGLVAPCRLSSGFAGHAGTRREPTPGAGARTHLYPNSPANGHGHGRSGANPSSRPRRNTDPGGHRGRRRGRSGHQSGLQPAGRPRHRFPKGRGGWRRRRP